MLGISAYLALSDAIAAAGGPGAPYPALDAPATAAPTATPSPTATTEEPSGFVPATVPPVAAPLDIPVPDEPDVPVTGNEGPRMGPR